MLWNSEAERQSLENTTEAGDILLCNKVNPHRKMQLHYFISQDKSNIDNCIVEMETFIFFFPYPLVC